MTRLFRHLCAPLLLAVAGCAPTPPPELPAEEPPVKVEEAAPEWRGIARIEDAQKIDEIDRIWDEAIARTGERRYRTASRDEGELVDPAAGLPRPAPAPGPYWCRTIKLGLSSSAGYVAFRPFNCYIEAEGELLTLVKQSGSERPAGRIYLDEESNRLVFLGGLALGREEEPPAYGDNVARNVIGVIERVGPFRYRLVIPRPQGDSVLDLIELVPLVEKTPALPPA